VCHAQLLRYDGFIPQVLQAIAKVNQSHGYRVLLEVVEGNGTPDAYANMVDSRQIDGMIVIDPATDDPQLRTLIDDGSRWSCWGRFATPASIRSISQPGAPPHPPGPAPQLRHRELRAVRHIHDAGGQIGLASARHPHRVDAGLDQQGGIAGPCRPGERRSAGRADLNYLSDSRDLQRLCGSIHLMARLFATEAMEG